MRSFSLLFAFALCAALLVALVPGGVEAGTRTRAQLPSDDVTPATYTERSAIPSAEELRQAEALIDANNARRAAAAAAKKHQSAKRFLNEDNAVLLTRVTPETLAAKYARDAAASTSRPRDAPYVLHAANAGSKIPAPSAGLNFSVFNYPTSQGLVRIFVGITEYPLGKFHVYPAPRSAQNEQASKKQSAFEATMLRDGKCDGTAATSASAQHYGCELAMNGGFFNTANGACLGNVYSNSALINVAQGEGQVIRANFGLTKNHNFFTGYLTTDQIEKNDIDGGFEELIQGGGWLVREGKNWINESNAIEKLGDGFLAEKAPRNALGHDKFGRLLQFEADGEEDIFLGLTLYEYSAILTEHFDVMNAINMDGGGSSTTVYQGKVADKPTCHDTPEECERSVTTISCVLP